MQTLKINKVYVPENPKISSITFKSKKISVTPVGKSDIFTKEKVDNSLVEQYVNNLMQTDTANWKNLHYRRFAEHGCQKVFKDPDLGKVTIGINYGLDGKNLLEKIDNWLDWKVDLNKTGKKVTILNCPIAYLDIPKKNIKIATTDKNSSVFRLATQKVLKDESEWLECKLRLLVVNLYKDAELEVIFD